MSVEDFWKSTKGILARLADIAHNFSWGTFNTSTKEFLAVLEEDPSIPEEDKGNVLAWRTMEDDKVCEEICQPNEGEYDPTDAFLPEMPAHVDCRCWWEIV